jgi:hypothetical protein
MLVARVLVGPSSGLRRLCIFDDCHGVILQYDNYYCTISLLLVYYYTQLYAIIHPALLN